MAALAALAAYHPLPPYRLLPLLAPQHPLPVLTERLLCRKLLCQLEPARRPLIRKTCCLVIQQVLVLLPLTLVQLLVLHLHLLLLLRLAILQQRLLPRMPSWCSHVMAERLLRLLCVTTGTGLWLVRLVQPRHLLRWPLRGPRRKNRHLHLVRGALQPEAVDLPVAEIA